MTWDGSACVGATSNPIIATTLKFENVSAAAINESITSNSQTVDAGGPGESVMITLSGPPSAHLLRNSINVGQSAEFPHGSSIQLRFITSSVYDQSVAISINAGGVVSTWSVQNRGDPAKWRRVFVTRSEWTGNLGGHTGADSKCQNAANAAKLGGQWFAYLGTPAMDPLEKVAANGGAKGWRLVDNRTVVFPEGQVCCPGSHGSPRMPPTAFLATDEYGVPSRLDSTIWYGGHYGPTVQTGTRGCPEGENCHWYQAPWPNRPRMSETCNGWTSSAAHWTTTIRGQVVGASTQVLSRSGWSMLMPDGSINYHPETQNWNTSVNPNGINHSWPCNWHGRIICLEK